VSRTRAATNLAATLRERNGPGDLDDAVGVLAPLVTEAEVPGGLLAIAATTLGHVEIERYLHGGEIPRLAAAEAAYRIAVDATTDAGASRARRLGHLAAAGIERWRADGDRSALLRAVAVLEDALGTPGGQTPLVMTNLAVALWELFEVAGERHHLDRAVALLRARNAAEPDDPDGNLRAVLTRQAELFGGDAPAVRPAARETPTGGAVGRPAELVNRAAAALDAYDATGRVADLEDAVAAYRAAVDATAERSPRRPARLADLASALRERARRFGTVSDLDEAENLLAAAAAAELADSPNAPRRHVGLALVLLDRVRRGGLGPARLDAALATATDAARHALGATPAASPDRPSRLGLLGACLLETGRRRGDRRLLDEAVALHRQALDELDGDSPARWRNRQNLGDALCERGAGDDYTEGAGLLRAVLTEARDPAAAVGAARNWSAAATRRGDWWHAAEAAVRGLGIVAALVDGQQARQHREGWLRDARALPASGAYALVQLRRPAAAAAVLDRGRAVLLSRAIDATERP
jgi:hypothetical protein